MKVDLILTGTGAAEPVYKGSGKLNFIRGHCCALLKTKTKQGRHFIKIDYTEHADFGLNKARIVPSSIDTLLVSHAHEDHLLAHVFFGAKLGLLPLCLDKKFTETPLKVYAPGPTIEAIREILARKRIPSTWAMFGPEKNFIVYQSIINKEEILFLYKVKPDQAVDLGKGVLVKFIGVPHFYDTAFADSGQGDTALGFLITVKEKKSFTVFYLTDYAQFSQRKRRAFIKSLAQEKIDLAVWGMPIPFPTDPQKLIHMGFMPTMELFLCLKKRKIIAADAPFILTHLSDRWEFPDLVRRTKLIVKNYQVKLWIPAEDGFTISFDKGKLKRKGKIL